MRSILLACRPAARSFLAILLSLVLVSLASGVAGAQTQLGGPGHSLHYNSRIHFYNPTGEAFTVTVHPRMFGNWDVGERFNPDELKIRITDPEGNVITKGKHPLKDLKVTIEVPEGPEGVYKMDQKGSAWIESSLDHSVLWTGHPDKHMVEGRRAVFAATVPRRWWFWVPKDTNEFTVKAQRANRYMSQREDWAYFIYSPRGQRMKALVGQPPYREGPHQQDQSVTVPVEPGTAGRFWSIRVAYGDSHNYSNINLALEGVPPYIARSPEEWFNPKTGAPPEVPLYDDTPFIQAAPKKEMMKKRWPNLEHFSPAPSLGDPDGILMRGDGRFAMWNPEGRELKFRIGTYLPRKTDGNLPTADVTITGPEGETVLDEERPLEHVHNKGKQPEVSLGSTRGVLNARVTGAMRWFTFTYPATPLVMTPREGTTSVDEWSTFRFTASVARNWYFYVPEGTETFSLRYDAKHQTDVIHMQVCAPNMAVDRLYGTSGETQVEVPDGLDGKIWYIRPKIGESTRITQESSPFRYQQSPMTVKIKGVPPYFAPTWEQWFDPRNPERPKVRGKR